MLPSGIRPTHRRHLQAVEVAKGLFVVPDAYEGEHDFFAPSPLARLRTGGESLTESQQAESAPAAE